MFCLEERKYPDRIKRRKRGKGKNQERREERTARVAINFANHLPSAPSRRRWSWLAQMLQGYHHGIRLPH
jgi:hypothetical protein